MYILINDNPDTGRYNVLNTDDPKLLLTEFNNHGTFSIIEFWTDDKVLMRSFNSRKSDISAREFVANCESLKISMDESVNKNVDFLAFGRESLVRFALVSLITQEKEAILDIDNFDSANIGIDLKINGVDVSLIKLLENLEEQMERIKKESRLEGFKSGKQFQLDKMAEWVDSHSHMVEL